MERADEKRTRSYDGVEWRAQSRPTHASTSWQRPVIDQLDSAGLEILDVARRQARAARIQQPCAGRAAQRQSVIEPLRGPRKM